MAKRKVTKTSKIYVWANGLIDHGNTVPDGTIQIGEGIKDWERAEVGARHMYNGSLVVGSVYDLRRAEAATDDLERQSILLGAEYPNDTPLQALNRWLAGLELGPYHPDQEQAA